MKIKPAKINTQKLKPKRRKVGRNVRNTNYSCPNCLSTIHVNHYGQWQCTGDKLNLLRKDFEAYEKMNTQQKQEYLDTVDNKDKFLALFSERDNLRCSWSNQEPKIQQTYSTQIPDPIAVGKIERSIGRNLTEEELEEGFKFYRKLSDRTPGQVYEYRLTAQESTDWREFILPRVTFPDET